MTDFAMVPMPAFTDRRLTLEHLRVLGALCSFRRDSSDFTVHPSRDEISKRCGMPVCKVSEATSALVGHGWLTKTGKGGFSKASCYTITVPKSVSVPNHITDAQEVTDTHEATVTDEVTVTQQGTGAVTESEMGMRVTESVTGIEEKNNKEEKVHAAIPTANKRSSGTTLAEFMASCKQRDEKLIPENDPIFSYAEKVGIDEEMLVACWHEFKAAHVPTTKRQKDWRAHYRNAVRRNWYKLWYLKDGGPAGWTTAGEQARRSAQ